MERANQVSTHGYCRARAQLGVYQLRGGHRAEARSAFEGAVHDDPNCVEAYTNLATLQREQLAQDPNFQRLIAQAASPQRDQQLDEMFRDIIGNIRQALARDDRFIPALNQLALAYLLRAGDDPRSQRLMLAGIVCSQAVQVTSQHHDEMAADIRSFVADVYNTWGLVDIRSGQIIRALDHFRRAYQLNANMFEAWMNFGTINLSFRGYADAREAFQHAVQLHDNDYDAHIGLGVALRGLGQLPQAQAEYERARTLDANRADAFYNLGVLYDGYMNGTTEELQRAIGYLQEFVTKAGGAPRYAEAVVRARHHIDNDRQAIQALQAVSALNAQGGGAGGSTAAPGGSAAAPASGGGAAAPAGGAPASGGAAPAGGAPAGGTAHPAGGAPAGGGAHPAGGH
jgi:tetratricopeptide (TPR) repeat protein